MIAGCIERMRQDACAGCKRADACASLMKAFGFGRSSPAVRPQQAPSAARTAANPIFAFLTEISKAFESKIPERRPEPRESPFRRDIEQRVAPILASGPVRIAEVASALGLSRQTLYRRLKTEGITFEALLDDLRRRLALQLLRDQGLSVKETAYRLGFSDPAAFSRAFKRWTGQSPTEMRNPKT